ncbi:MAG TPA: VTT domain-containing protein [Gammaproteobacteria bacterium]|nr:VTT domain-containing protein [Gammaproteobacteria bacterium]
MTQESIQPFLDWITANPNWSGFIVFLISLSESLAIVGLVVPGVVMMTAIGGMMGSGHLPFWATLSWAILGAIAGDGISYWLGYHYHQQLRNFWPFKQFPKLLARGETFFTLHGGKSIIFGRFVGPVRPMIPVIAGMMDMSPKRFLFFNILSAIAWAPLYCLPGILIGASLGTLPPEVASRAGLLVLLLLLAFWLIYETLLLIGAWVVKTLTQAINGIWKILRRLPWLHSALRNAQGSEQSQLGILIFCVLAFTGFAITLRDILNSEGITSWNEPVYQVLRALYSTKIIHWTGFLTGLGDPWILLPAAAAIGLWLFWRQRYTAAFCWFLTISIGFVSGWLVKTESAIPRPEGLVYLSHRFAFPSAHTLTATLVFGLAAMFIHQTLSMQQSPTRKYRWAPWAIAVPLILWVAFSRVYLGMHWFTDIVGSLTLGSGFVTLGTLIYRRVESRPIPIRAIVVPGLLVMTVTLSLYATFFYPKLRTELIRQWATHTLQEKIWWHGKGDTNTLYRTGAFKRQATIFDVQWLGSLESVQSALEKAGWKVIPKLNFKTGVILLANNPSPLLFPTMPKFHRDRLPILAVTKKMSETRRVVFQLWRSDYQTEHKTPLWVGTLRVEEAIHPLPLVTTFLEQPERDDILEELAKSLNLSSGIHTHIISTKHANNCKVLLLKS